MTALLTHLRNASRACTTGYEISLSIKEVREIVAMIDGRWQPIEIAPKDGTRILATNGQAIEVIFFAQGWFNQSAEISLWRAFPPTHWMPLPEPPPATSSPEEVAQFIDAMKTTQPMIGKPDDR